MRTALIVLILGLAASSVMTQNCAGTNSFFSLISFDTSKVIASGSAAVKATADGAKCGWTAGTTDICVAQADQTLLMTTIQTYITSLKTTLQDNAGKRDQYFIDQRGEVVEVLASLRRLNELVSDATIPSSATDYVTLFGGFATEISKNFTAIVANLEAYQTARQGCMDNLLQTQAAIICTAAQQASGSTGSTIGATSTIVLDDAVLGTITSSCYNYIDYSATQSSIIYTNLYGKVLSALVSAIEKLVNNDSSASTDFATAISEFSKITVPSTNYQIPVQKPTACTSATAAGCVDWVETNFFGTDGTLTQNSLITAGNGALITFSRRLEEGNQRRLAATGGVVVDLTKYTFTTGFEENPGNVDNTKNANSALRNGIVACAVAALALVF